MRNFLPAGVLLFLAASAAAQPTPTYKDTGSIFCICPDGRRGHINSPDTCEGFCGGGSSAPGPDWGEIRARQEREARERAEREAAAVEAARRARKALEQQKFEAEKKAAISTLKGVSTGEPTLKGVSAEPNGLKGLDEPDSHGLKGLDSSPKKTSALKGVGEGEGGPKKCVVVDSCMDALEEQKAALESSRKEQADLYMAVGTADLGHGLELAHAEAADRLKGAIEPVAKIHVWHDDDKAGLPMYIRDYKHSVDDVVTFIGRKRAAALNGRLDPARTPILKSEELKQTVEGLHEELDEKIELVQRIKGFRDYARALSACGAVPPSEYLACVDKVGHVYKAVIEALPIEDATQARVKAIGEAFTRYSTHALENAMKVSRSATKCFKGCR